ncbi:DUF1413 domain-containing protein [Planococcus salinarum]|uniref:DUF1413 domain-containing protein n=1 Tax=Planococcus salinarum TaxID=622695 RepID=UPI00163DB390|nr:DUF1413 domain-containing protein [Planococcus salinarum]
MKTVRLNLSETEYSNVYDLALEKGFASIPEYLRYLLFNEKPETLVDFEELIAIFESAIKTRKDNNEFRVRDCYDKQMWSNIGITERRTLGRMIIRKVEKGGWLPIVATSKDSGNAQWYMKRGE